MREGLEIRRKVLESETRRIRDSQTTMSSEQILGLIKFIVDVMRQSVLKYADRIIAQQILRKITTNIGLFVSKPHQAPPGIARLLA